MNFDIKRILILTNELIIASCLTVLCSSALADDFELTEIADGVYVHHGKHVSFENPEHDDIANIGFIVGDKCVAVIDTGGSIKIGELLYQAVNNTTSKPVCYVINTHVHFDHLLGNYAFKDSGAKFIGHYELGNAIASNKAFFLEEFANDLGVNPTEEMIISPDISVEDTLEIDLGNRKLTLTAYQPAHSHSDLTIYDQKTDSLWLSDLLFVDRIPVLDGSLKGWLEVMKMMQAFNPSHFIPGHGRNDLDWDEALAPQDHYLSILLDETRKQIEQGAFMEEAINEIGKEEKLKWQLYEQSHKRNVSKAFTELEWE